MNVRRMLLATLCAAIAAGAWQLLGRTHGSSTSPEADPSIASQDAPTHAEALDAAPTPFDRRSAVAEGDPAHADAVDRRDPRARDTFRLVAFDGDQRCEFFGARLTDAHTNAVLAIVPPDVRPDGELEIAVPNVPFRLRPLADCCDTLDLGPLDPSTVRERVEAELQPSPGFAGRIVARGRPIDGASIVALRTIPPHVGEAHDGLPVLQERDGERTLSLRGGRFWLRSRESGTFVLTASVDGVPRAQIGPLDLDGRTQRRDLVIDVPPVGHLHGRVLDAQKQPVPGTNLLVSRGEAAPRLVRAGDDGSYACADLQPGSYWIRVTRSDAQVRQDLRAGARGIVVGGWGFRNEPPKSNELPPYAIEVHSGESSELDVLLGPPALLDVHLSSELLGGDRWHLSSRCREESPWDRGFDRDLEQREPTRPIWRLALTSPARVVIRGSNDAESIRCSVERSFDVPVGSSTVRVEPPLGALEVSVPGDAGRGRVVVVAWLGTDGTSIELSGEVVDGPRIKFPRVPAGTCEVWCESQERETVQVEAGTTLAVAPRAAHR